MWAHYFVISHSCACMPIPLGLNVIFGHSHVTMHLYPSLPLILQLIIPFSLPLVCILLLLSAYSPLMLVHLITHTRTSLTLPFSSLLMRLAFYSYPPIRPLSFSLRYVPPKLYIGCFTEILGRFLQQQHSVSLILLSLSL